MSLKQKRKMLAETWLEYTFGWQPLMADIASAAKAYSWLKSKNQTARIFGKGQSSSTPDQIITPFSWINYCHGRIFDSKSTTAEIRFKGVIKIPYTDINTTTASEILRLSGFQLSEFVPALWELLPWSFVIDYFTNIGDILNSIHGLQAEYVWWTRSDLIKSTHTYDFQVNEALLKLNTAILSWQVTAMPGSWNQTWYNRIARPNLALPGLRLQLPASGFQWANLLALQSARI